MLRCPPSRINLTSADVKGLEHRLAARQANRLPRPDTSNVRLSPGPGHPTRLSIVAVEQGPKLERTISAVSEGECCDASDAPTQSIVNITGPLPQNVHRPKNLCEEGAEALHTAAQQRQSPAKSEVDLDGSHRLPSDGHTIPSHSPSRLDGTYEHQTTYALLDSRPLTRRGNMVLEEMHTDAQPSSGVLPAPPPSVPLASSQHRAGYHRHASSQDIPVRADPMYLQEAIYRYQMHRPVPNLRRRAEPECPVPALIFPEDASTSTLNLGLDPGAPVFIPRTRFGSAMRSSSEGIDVIYPEPHWGSVDTTHHVSNLRIRSSSERNADQRFHRRRVPDMRTAETSIDQIYYRSRSTNNLRHRIPDQNSFIAPHGPIAGPSQFPLLEPSSRQSSAARQTDSAYPGHDSSSTNDISRSTSAASYYFATDPDRIHHDQSRLHVHRFFQSDNDRPAPFASRVRSASPAFSANSYSTPNLLRLPFSAPPPSSRESSRSWSTSGPRRTRATNRTHRMVSAASGASGGDDGTRLARSGLDATEEFLRRRNSPLDELTEQFSRMRSVGRSWETVPDHHSRISLLSGDIFGLNEVAHPLSSRSSPPLVRCVQEPLGQTTADGCEEERPASADADLVTLALALLPSSPPSMSSQALPSSSPALGNDSSNPRSAPVPPSSPNQYASTASPEPSVPCKPAARATATPKVNVYNDSLPPSFQAQTPADITRSRRRNNHSELSGHQSPFIVGNMSLAGPPVVPERQVHRNTHASGAAHAPAATASSSTGGMDSAAGFSHRHRHRSRTHGQRGNEPGENDLHGMLPGLEEDRRTWLSRREAGDMDVTPPKEGRFERFLS